MAMPAWAVEKIEELRGLKSPTDGQRLALLLADKADRSDAETRNLQALLKAERAADRARSARAAAARLVANASEAERKARTRKMIEVGGLVELAGLADQDRGALLGLLLSAAKQASDPESLAAAKRAGDAMLSSREADRKAKKAA
jgi:hypothetical protein